MENNCIIEHGIKYCEVKSCLGALDDFEIVSLALGLGLIILLIIQLIKGVLCSE